MMKRQRGAVSGVSVANLNPSKFEGTTMEVAAMVAMQGKKKPKKENEKVKEKVGQSAAEEERKVKKELGLFGTVDNMVGWNLEENWAWLQDGLVDEQMSWSSAWCPVWDVDFNAEAFGSLYNDVFWDDDIWNLKKEIPNPSVR
ncbi:hypothetical protein L6164_026865 [Bauhinia variegata]|uniref:Uncharacterized protein n=1 Tax=Bauhinia variegata TaxID=167791 RepID=A0ACB9LS56_BAUVA|nr:hypothetical protein L6164_026865 [Bauhinia variegata]